MGIVRRVRGGLSGFVIVGPSVSLTWGMREVYSLPRGWVGRFFLEGEVGG